MRHILSSCLMRNLHMRYTRMKKATVWTHSGDHDRNLCAVQSSTTTYVHVRGNIGAGRSCVRTSRWLRARLARTAAQRTADVAPLSKRYNPRNLFRVFVGGVVPALSYLQPVRGTTNIIHLHKHVGTCESLSLTSRSQAAKTSPTLLRTKPTSMALVAVHRMPAKVETIWRAWEEKTQEECYGVVNRYV